MIDFRYHIVSLIAVFLALALGLFLGSTTLQSTVTHNLHSQADRVTKQNRTLEAQRDQARQSLKSEEALTAALEPYVVSGRLSGQTIAVVSAPGVDSGDRADLLTTLKTAGATVTADVQLDSAYLDPTQDAELGALATEIALPSHPLPAGNGATRVSAVLSEVLVARPGHHVPSRARIDAALSALADGKFISVTGTPSTQPATLALLLVPGPSSGVTATTAAAQNALLVSLASDLQGAANGEVVTGPTPVGGIDPGALAAVRADSTLSKTVATVGTDTQNDAAAGRIATVVALRTATAGAGGTFGLGNTPPVPAPSPSATS